MILLIFELSWNFTLELSWYISSACVFWCSVFTHIEEDKMQWQGSCLVHSLHMWVLLFQNLHKLCVSRRDTLINLTTLISVVHCVCFIMYGMHGEFICMV